MKIDNDIKLEVKIIAHELRYNQTNAEKLLWSYLGDRQIEDIKPSPSFFKREGE